MKVTKQQLFLVGAIAFLLLIVIGVMVSEPTLEDTEVVIEENTSIENSTQINNSESNISTEVVNSTPEIVLNDSN